MELELLMNDKINAGNSHIEYYEYTVPPMDQITKPTDIYLSSISFQTKTGIYYEACYDDIIQSIKNLHKHNEQLSKTIKYIRYLGSVYIINDEFKRDFPVKTILKKQISIHVLSPYKTVTKMGECLSNINIKLCANGICNISGCRSIDDIQFSLRLIDAIIPEARIDFDKYSVIVASASISFKISIKSLYKCLIKNKQEYDIKQIIEPTNSRLIIKDHHGTITIFPRGGINISASGSLEHIRQLYDKIIKIIYGNIREVYMGENEKFHKINKISHVPDVLPVMFHFRERELGGG